LAPFGIAHSGRTSRKLQGVLRSPTFLITQPQIHMRINAAGAMVRLVIDSYVMAEFNGLLFNGTLLKGGGCETKGEFAWKTMRFHPRYVGHRAHLEFLDQGDGFIAVDQVLQSPSGAPPESPHAVTMAILKNDQLTSLASLAKHYGELMAGSLDRCRQGKADATDNQTVNLLLSAGLVNDSAEPLAGIRNRFQEVERAAPKPMRVMAIADGTGEDERVFIRGSHVHLGEVAPRQLVTALDENQPPIARGSGRLELARRLTNPANPFPSRVMANRIWHHLFGRGLVSSVDDFGVMGLPPSHPELLDRLASDFIQDGWSVKRAIRRVVLSNTYRMASHPKTADPKAAEVDPTNALLHRAPIRRLQAEAVRDAMLTVSGRLDRKLLGASVPVHLTSFMEGRGRPRGGPLDGSGRRSVYVSIRRNFLPSMMLAFDMPSPFSTMGRRSVSNVPAQALILMNDPFVVGQAQLWAKRVLAEQPDADARITAMFRDAFAHPPSETQLERAKAFLAEQAKLHNANENDPKVWADLAHTLFNMKEFIYLN
ncbi:MAG: DUF1553 domain-containing protein, partial [Planctomycetales bacterium]